jgi:hypothetical protein
VFEESRYFVRADRYVNDPKSPTRYRLVQQLRMFGEITEPEAEGYRAFIGRSVVSSLPYDDARTIRLAEAFGFEAFLGNIQSESGRFVILEVSRAEREGAADDDGAWDEAGEKLMHAHERFQPHLVHELLEGGAPICRPEFFREGACLINLFLEGFADSINARLKAPHKDLTHEALYEMATGLEAPADGPLPVSLTAATAWMRKWRIPAYAVNLIGELIYRYDPREDGKQVNSNLKKGPRVFYLVAHDNHAYTIPRDNAAVHKFADLVTGQDVRTPEGRLERRRRELAGTLGQQLPCAKLWHHPKKREPLTAESCAVVDCANGCIEILEDAERKGVKMAITGAEPDELIQELWAQNHEVLITQMKFGVAEAFVVQMARRTLYVRRAVDGETRGDQPCLREDFTIETQNVFDSALLRLRETVTPRNALSRYSPALGGALRAYKRGPRVGRFGAHHDLDVPAHRTRRFIGVDVRRAYTAELMAIRAIPVFSIFDEPRGYTAGDKIEATSYYLVRVTVAGRDGIIFSDEHDGVWGETVEFARAEGLPFEIVGVCTPHRVVKVSCAAEIQRLYGEVSDDVAKAVPNIAYGFGNKNQSSKQEGRLFKSEEEARSVSSCVMAYGPGFLAMMSGKQELAEGYLPVARLVLEGARRKLYKAAKALRPIGAVAVRSDCVYVPEDRVAEIPAAMAAAGLIMVDKALPVFENVGRFRLEEPKALCELPREPLGPRRSSAAPSCEFIIDAPAFVDIDMADEWDAEEATALYPLLPGSTEHPCAASKHHIPAPIADDDLDELLADDGAFATLTPPGAPKYWWMAPQEVLADLPELSHDNLLIVADVPGAGKSYLSKQYARDHGEVETTLFVDPWNTGRDDDLADGFHAVTLHTLCGKIGGDNADGAKKPLDVSGYKRVVFQEVFLYPTPQRGWILAFCSRHPELAYTGNGDPGQNRPVGEELAMTDAKADAYAFSNLATIFPRRLTLHRNKRCGAAESARMEALCANLLRAEKPAREILLDAGLHRIAFDDMCAGDWAKPQIAAYRSTVRRANATAHQSVAPLGQGLRELRVGDRVVGADGGCRGRGGRINSNATYSVLAVGSTHVKLIGNDGGEREITNEAAAKKLARPYVNTCHAYQGTSLGPTVYIHDWQSPMATHRWVRTAVSRATSMNIVLVDSVKTVLAVSDDLVAGRIAGHAAADAAKGMAYEDKDYVNPEWVHAQFRKQGWGCGECGGSLEDWSVDRINNALPHAQNNCQIVCRPCQHASGHREQQQDAAARQEEAALGACDALDKIIAWVI